MSQKNLSSTNKISAKSKGKMARLSDFCTISRASVILFLGGMAGGAIGILIFLHFVTPPLNIIGQPYVTAVEAYHLSDIDQSHLLSLITLGAVTTTSSVISQVTTFHSTLIGVLLTALGLLNLFGLFFIKARAAEELAKDIAGAITTEMETMNFQRRVESAVSVRVKTMSGDIDGQLDQVRSQIDHLVKAVHLKQSDSE